MQNKTPYKIFFSELKKNEPQKLTFCFFPNIYDYKIVLKTSENGMYSIELGTNNRCTQFQANIFIFGCAMAKKNR